LIKDVINSHKRRNYQVILSSFYETIKVVFIIAV